MFQFDRIKEIAEIVVGRKVLVRPGAALLFQCSLRVFVCSVIHVKTSDVAAVIHATSAFPAPGRPRKRVGIRPVANNSVISFADQPCALRSSGRLSLLDFRQRSQGANSVQTRFRRVSTYVSEKLANLTILDVGLTAGLHDTLCRGLLVPFSSLSPGVRQFGP